MCRDTYTQAARYWRGEARGLRASIGTGPGTGRHRDPEINFQLTHAGSSSDTKQSGDDVCTCMRGVIIALPGNM